MRKTGIHNLIASAAVIGGGMFAQISTAAPVFTVDPGGLGSSRAEFTADQISGISSELLSLNPNIGAGTATGSGWLNFTSFANAGTPRPAFVTGLQDDPAVGGYQLYLTFSLETELKSGTFGQAGSDYFINSLNVSIWGDTDFDTTFVTADASENRQATVNQNMADVLLGGGSLITSPLNEAGFDDGFGAFLNAITSLGLTAAGEAYFIDPVPFYNVAFSAFNNTTQGVERAGDCLAAAGCLISINQAVGTVDFNMVPEPASLALVGLGLLGMGSSLRKRHLA